MSNGNALHTDMTRHQMREIEFGLKPRQNADQCEATERFAFYERVSRAYAIVQTGELQAWANFLFKKGVIAEGLRQ